MVPEVYSGFQVMREYISAMATLKFTQFLNKKNKVLLKIMAEILYLVMCLFHVIVSTSNCTSCTHETSHNQFKQGLII